MTGEAWLASRHISKTTWQQWPVVFASLNIGGNPEPCVVFNYVREGKRLNYKARCINHKNFTQQNGGETLFWNLERVLKADPLSVYITEGEIDALSLAESGIEAHEILSVPNGAPPAEGRDGGSVANDNVGERRRYAHILDALKSGLAKVQRFVICVDNDGPGRRLRADLAQVLGQARCWFVDWPEGCKDANDVLMKQGPFKLYNHVVSTAKPWPVVGIYTLDELPEPPELKPWELGFDGWERKIKIAPRMLSVLTGYPGHGKSQFVQQLWFQIAKQYDFPFAIFSAETGAKPYVRRTLRQLHSGKTEWNMDGPELAAADRWISDHVIFLSHPNHRPQFGWLMDVAETAVVRYGCRAAIVDPWNKIEPTFDIKKGGETQWIGDCLDTMLDASRAWDVHWMVLAHPAKPPPERRKFPPDLYAISGSQHWNNRVDQGFAIHRPKIVDESGERCTVADFYHLKTRFSPDLGWPCKMELNLNLATGAYETMDNATPNNASAWDFDQ